MRELQELYFVVIVIYFTATNPHVVVSPAGGDGGILTVFWVSQQQSLYIYLLFLLIRY